MRPLVSHRSTLFTESVIREMTRLCNQHGGVNLAQGFPDFPAPEAVKEEAARAVRADVNQYAITWGAKRLRDAIVAKTGRFTGLAYDPEREVTVCCGSTECMISALLALVNPGEEVVIFEPFYENYGPDAIVSGARARYVRLPWPDWTIDEEALKAAFNRRTKAIILNTPNNPTGKVFTRDELRLIADLCVDHDAVAVTDEIYEHIVYEGEHVSIASLDGMADRTVTINGLSKTYSVTGWRVGWAIAPKTIADALKRVHDFLTVGAPHPLQIAGVTALALPMSYYRDLAAMYRKKRDFFVAALKDVGFEVAVPHGAYYVMAHFRRFGEEDDVAFAKRLVEKIGIAVVPGSSFYSHRKAGRRFVRFMFSKREETLEEAARRLRALAV
ncbi:MAG: aminotransferase class I/II-fold pyridoxal phosphate-dependent enzyme [Gemmatimonadetes bacterium]|nr:aminotransferase class I/II-fold pyridoxal phosphate-dependent enzyme [Gemmatimonadota bacterium]